MCSQIISVTGDSHHCLLINAFKELLENNIAVNCTIVAEGYQVKAHQVLLSSFSPFLELLIKEKNEEHPTIILADTNFQDLKAVIYYMYHGKLEIPQDRLRNLLETAKYLQIKGLGDASEDDSSEKNLILPLCERQMYPRKQKRMNEYDVIELEQNNINKSQSYRQSTHQLTGKVPSGYNVGQLPIHCLSSEVTLEKSSIQRLSSFPVPSTSLSSEPNFLQPVVNIEPQAKTFATKNMHPHEPKRQESEEVYLRNSSRNKRGHGTRKEANICISANVSVKTEDNSSECNLLPVCASSGMFNLPPDELLFPKTRPSGRQLKMSSESDLSNATRDTLFLFVDPAELESDELFHSELDLKSEDIPQEEITMLNEAGIPYIKAEAFEQGEPLAKDEHIATERSECSGVRSSCAASSNGSSLSCSTQAPESSALSPVFLTTKSGAKRKGNAASRLLKRTVCPECHKSFRFPYLLRMHMLRHTELKPYKCTQCDYKSCSKNNMRSHDFVHKVERPYQCVLCDYSAARRNDLIRHGRTHTGEKPYKCHECDYIAAEKCNLTVHSRTHTRERPYKCMYCTYAATQRGALIKHQRSHTGEKPYKCDECGYAASVKSDLVTHIRTHTGEKPYKCSECDYASVDTCKLKRHLRIHTGERPYKCSECDYAAADHSTLSRHCLIHTKVRPYKCMYCTYAASQRGALIIHQRIHTGEKPYKCDDCGYAAGGRSALVTHIRTHTGEKPYKCSECDYAAIELNKLKRHLRIHTG